VDEQLERLIDDISRYPDPSPERQKALNGLLLVIQRLPGIYKSSHQDYLEALNRTWEWVCNNIGKFQPQSPSVQTSLVIWINGYLRWRIKDFYAPNSKYTYSLDRPVYNNEGVETTLLDILPSNPESPRASLDLLDIKIAQIQETQRQNVGSRIKQYIELDENGKLTGSHPKKNPECNCQVLTKRLLLQKPSHKIADIAREFNVSNQTLYSHWKKNCLPLLKEIAVNCGHEE
jgi:hypothetical protein